MFRKITLLIIMTLTSCTVSDLEKPGPLSKEDLSLNTETVRSPILKKPGIINYFHPMQHAMLPEGMIFNGIKEDPSGNHYAVGEQISQKEGQHTVYEAGVLVLETHKLTDDEKADILANKRPKYHHVREKINPSIYDDILSLSEDEYFVLQIASKKHPDHRSINEKIDIAIANGDISNEFEKFSYKKTLIKEQQMQVKSVLDPLKLDLEQRGIEVIASCKNIYCMDLKVQKHHLSFLESDPRISVVDPVRDAKQNTVDGLSVSYGLQIYQFQKDNYLGDYSSYGRVKLAVIEHYDFNDNHVVFRDSSGTSTRIQEMRNCSPTCSDVTSFASPIAHATGSASLAVGDITDGQDVFISNVDSRRQRSGYGRETEIYLCKADGLLGNVAIDNCIDDMVGFGVDIISMSISDNADPCHGQSVASKALNSAYESGIAVFVAAGNGTHVSTTDCKVEGPADAVGAIAVGGTVNNYSDDEQDIRTGTIYSGSSRGGTSSEGGNRTIIDVVAPALIEYAADETYDYNYQRFGVGTSISAPIVAGAASNFMDFYRSEFSAAIDDPGKMQAHLLAMGDRESQSSKLTSQFDNVWGAGRLKMRRWDAESMDSPWQMISWSTCIDDGEVYYFNINGGNVVSGDIETLKYVVYWYDEDHEDTGVVSDVDLALQRKSTGTGTSWGTVQFSYDSSDDKERVAFDATYYPANYYWRLKIVGSDITADTTACGTNSVRVNLVGFYEDSDRDDIDGPSISNTPPSDTDIETDF